jgi:pimeloyl-ACP methyl ester carboxylesterase
MAFVRRHGVKLSAYDFGRTTIHACQADPRFSWCAYVPEDYDEAGTERYQLLVSVHGTMRDMVAYRDDFIPFAERSRCIVLAPLFPAGITSPGDVSSYKLMTPSAVRYDAVLLAMVEEVQARYRIAGDRFALFGFSGGGHFAHRFLYLHPKRLSAVSIGAPGIVTLLDFEHDFWVGVRDFESVMGRPIDLEAMRRVAVQMVIGGNDTETWEITLAKGSPLWRPDGEIAGMNRPERMRALKSSFENHGVAVRHDTVQGVAHRHAGLLPAVTDFLAEAMPQP